MMPPRHEVSRADGGEPHRDGGPEEAAHFIAEKTAELAQLARRHRHEMLAYLLDMAMLEAEHAAHRRPAQY